MTPTLIIEVFAGVFVGIGLASTVPYCIRKLSPVLSRASADHWLSKIHSVLQTQNEMLAKLMQQPQSTEQAEWRGWAAELIKLHQAALTNGDVIADRIKKQNEYIQLFCRTLTGNDPSGISEMTDEQAALREKAIAIQRRYGLTWEEALKRARDLAVYETDRGFGAEV